VEQAGIVSIPKNQKFTADNPCPVCSGYDLAPRGKGERCYGFGSEDGKYANCTRDEFAGSLQKNPNSNTYSHYMVGRCKCGTNHTGSFTAPAPLSHSNSKSASATKEVIDWDNPVAVYEYGEGSDAFEVVRFEPKNFRQRRMVDGKHIWNLEGITRSLYHQKEVEAAGINEPIYVGEGEKDTHTLEALGLVATTCPQGAGKWLAIYNEVLKGRTVILLEDKDEAGKAHVLQVADDLSSIAKSVKVLRIPNLPEKGDVTDFVEAGGTVEELQAMVAATPEYSVVDAGGWGSMEPLPAATPPVPTLPPELLPEPLREWLVDVAERTPVPLEFVAMSALSGLGSVIGRQIGINPEQFDDYTVVPNLWGAIVGRSGKMKTHAISEGLRHVRRLEQEAADLYEEASANREAGRVFLKAETDILNSEIKSAVANKDSGKADALQLELTELINKRDKSDTPAQRYITQDSTVEKLGVLLQDNPHGLLIFRDELAGWLQTLEKSGREGDREFYLEAWNGTGSFSVDRIGRGLTRIPALTLTLCGSIQPGKLKRYVAEAVSGGAGSDGLLQRVQLLVYPDESAFPAWKPSKEWSNTEAKNNAWAVYKRLSDIQLPDTGDQESNHIPTLHFTTEAQELHTVWRSELENRLRTETVDTPAFESHISKYRSLAPALALIYYLAELSPGDVIESVPIDPLKKALALCEFLEVHARKVFAPELNHGLASAYALSKKILSGAVHDGDTIREIYRHGWTDLTDSKDTFAAVEVLERHGWVCIKREATAGRATDTLSLHSELRGKTNG
jgi:putative DNA primase/helicase